METLLTFGHASCARRPDDCYETLREFFPIGNGLPHEFVRRQQVLGCVGKPRQAPLWLRFKNDDV